MGSDMYMAEQSFRPKPNYAEWDGDSLVIYRDYFMDGYGEIWRGKVNLQDESMVSLIKTMVANIPSKPAPPEYLDKEIRRIVTTFVGYECGLTDYILELLGKYGVDTKQSRVVE